MKQYLVPFFVGVVVAIAGGGALAARVIAQKKSDVVRGWALKPIVVAAVDVTEGETLTFDHISQRSVPEQFVNGSNVRPDEASLVIGQKIAAPIQAGDPLTWQFFTPRDGRAAQCAKDISPAVIAAGDAVAERSAAEFVKGLEPLPQTGEVKRPAGSVVVTTQDISENTVLTAAMLRADPYTAELITPSNVPADRIADLVGARTAVPLQKGDAVLWQLLDSGRRPRSARSCELAVLEAVHAERERAAAREVEKRK